MDLVIKGAMISGALIMAIGSQNAFVLKQGLLRQHILAVVLTCFVCDMLLMVMGVLGLGSLINASRTLSVLLAGFGALFLLWYGARSLFNAFQSSQTLDQAAGISADAGRRQVILSTLAITLLNPHVYLDTVVIIGGVAGTLPLADKALFLMGALLASLTWFFGLGYGARCLWPLLRKPKAWRVLELLIGGTMWWIAYGLVRFVLLVL